MKNIKFKNPQVIEVESLHTSNIKDALLECALLAKKYNIDIDFNFRGYQFWVNKNSDLNEMLENWRIERL